MVGSPGTSLPKPAQVFHRFVLAHLCSQWKNPFLGLRVLARVHDLGFWGLGFRVYLDPPKGRNKERGAGKHVGIGFRGLVFRAVRFRGLGLRVLVPGL